MNIAFVNTSYRLGGAETVAHDLLEGCVQAGHGTRFYVAAGKTYPRDRRIVPLYPRVLSRLFHSRLRGVVERCAPREIWTDRRFKSLASGWPDLVHVHNFHGDYASVASLGFVARRKPVVWTFHGHWGVTGGCDHPLECTRYEERCGDCPRLGVWPLGRVDDTAWQLQQKQQHLREVPLHVVAPARFLADRIARSRVGRDWNVHHIPNGVSPDVFHGQRKHDPKFRRALGFDPASISVLVTNRNFRDPQKGFSIVREALTAFAANDPGLQVILAGAESDWAASQLPPQVRALSVGYVNSRRQLAALFEAADVFLFASPAENFPCVILEAMASECCVVATPSSGVTEQIENLETGMLADAISGEALARTLAAALQDGERRRTLGVAARRTVLQRWTTDLMVRGYLDLYASARGRLDRNSGESARPLELAG
jgi:glycosyltransferase involved in cell wall biosynthesis